MENLKPPPNSSPEEIQAWNHMMDTMVTFIKASTHLMNTITLKVKAAAASSGGAPPAAASGSGYVEPMDCEPECLMCHPKPAPCGICGKKVPAAHKHPRAQETPRSTELLVQPREPPIAESREPPPEPFITAEPIKPPESEPTSEPPFPNVQEEPPDIEPTPEPSIRSVPEEPSGSEPPTEASLPVVEEVSSGIEPAPEPSAEPDVELPPEPSIPAKLDDPSVEPPKRHSEETGPPIHPSIVKPGREPSREKPPFPPLPLAAAGDVQCVCSSIRAKRFLLQSQRARCECYCKVKREKEQVEIPEEVEQSPEILCGCGPSAKQREIMEQEMVEKLVAAEREIAHLQEEMARLQRMNPKKPGPHGTPNAAQLYQEIMRGSKTYQGTGATIREQGVRNLSNVRMELFQSPGWSAYDNVRGVGSSGSYQSQQYGRGRGMPCSSVRGSGYQGERGSASGMRQPGFRPSLPVQGGGFQSLAGGTVFSPDLSRDPPQTGGSGFQSLPGSTVFSPNCPPTCASAQSGGPVFQSLPGGTVFSPEYSESPFNIGSRKRQDSSQAGSRGIPAGLSGAGASCPGRPKAAQYYQQAQAQYRPSPQQRPGGQSPSAMSGYGGQESSGRDEYWSRLGEYGSPVPPIQRQDIDCVCSPKSTPRSSGEAEPQRQVIICVPPEDAER